MQMKRYFNSEISKTNYFQFLLAGILSYFVASYDNSLIFCTSFNQFTCVYHLELRYYI